MKTEDLFAHELIPKHEIISVEEKKKLLEDLKITPKQLPKIFDDDAIVEAIEAKKDDILKITRASPTAGKTIFYRLVTER